MLITQHIFFHCFTANLQSTASMYMICSGLHFLQACQHIWYLNIDMMRHSVDGACNEFRQYWWILIFQYGWWLGWIGAFLRFWNWLGAGWNFKLMVSKRFHTENPNRITLVMISEKWGHFSIQTRFQCLLYPALCLGPSGPSLPEESHCSPFAATMFNIFHGHLIIPSLYSQAFLLHRDHLNKTLPSHQASAPKLYLL